MEKQKRARSTLTITLLRGACIGLIALGSVLSGSARGQARTWPPAQPLSALPKAIKPMHAARNSVIVRVERARFCFSTQTSL